MGDALLSRLGRQLDALVSAFGSVYRLGGDEFCVIARGSERQIQRIAEASQAALSEFGEGFAVTSSCGQALVPRDARNVALALHTADERLYAQKERRQRSSVGTQTGAALLQALEEREPELRGHLDMVAKMSVSVARCMGLFGEELEDVDRAAQLHDVGKVAIPDAILQKPGALDASEWDFIHRHTIVGERILLAAPSLSNVARLVRASHERYDGGGYPDGLSGEEIPLGARIVTACDAYNSMTSERPYGSALSSEQALAELRRCAGEQFDPVVVEAVAEELGHGAGSFENLQEQGGLALAPPLVILGT